MKSKPGLVVLALDGAVPSYIRQKIKENRLPAFKRFSEMGCWFSDCRPPFPTITPTCWASFSTGAAPVTHGAVCQDVHVPGTALDEAITAYNSENIRAERFWEAAGRIGKKSLIIQLPTSGPARSDKVLQVAGAGCSTIRYEYPHEPTASPEGIQHLVPAQLFVSGDEKGNSAQWIYRSPASGQWQPGEKKHVKHDIEIVEDRIAMLKADMSGVNSSIYPFNWYVKIEDGQVKLSETLDKVEDGVIIPEGQWSPVIVRELEGKDGIIACRFRAKLFYANAGERKFKIFFNEAGDAARYITPSYFRDEALAIPGIFPSHGHHKYLNNGIDYKTFLELEAMNFDWQWQLMKKTWENHEVDITVVYSVYLDTINHQYRSIFEGLVPASDREFREAHQLYEDAYMLADEFLGKIIDFVDEETTIVAVSDHGSMGYNTIISPFTVLERAGLLAYNDTGVPGKKTVDWSRTLAYPVGTCHVYVNLKGRDPHGIVDERDYDMVVNRIIKVLQDGFRDDKKGICALAFALRREEAGLAGQGGEYCGDVVYGLAGTTIGGYYGGVHACQIPTARTSTGDMRALFVIAGPGFKKGEVISRCVHLYDAAPTLCYALGYPQPAHAEGRIVFDALNF